jgi:AcrR family transcriptional regulator
MPTRRKQQLSLRKNPQQARSAGLVATILQAATDVLRKEGARRFTTARVAHRAGVSVGSVYQYFPNKAAILFRLQSDEWRQTSDLLRRILEDLQKSPLERLRTLVHAFIRSECDEADVRVALGDAAPLYRDAPEAKEARASEQQALPQAPKATCALVGHLITSTLSAVGKQFSSSPRKSEDIDAYAESMSDMFCAYLHHVNSTVELTKSPQNGQSAI